MISWIDRVHDSRMKKEQLPGFLLELGKKRIPFCCIDRFDLFFQFLLLGTVLETAFSTICPWETSLSIDAMRR